METLLTLIIIVVFAVVVVRKKILPLRKSKKTIDPVAVPAEPRPMVSEVRFFPVDDFARLEVDINQTIKYICRHYSDVSFSIDFYGGAFVLWSKHSAERVDVEVVDE